MERGADDRDVALVHSFFEGEIEAPCLVVDDGAESLLGSPNGTREAVVTRVGFQTSQKRIEQ